jgi:hypothetical protein
LLESLSEFYSEHFPTKLSEQFSSLSQVLTHLPKRSIFGLFTPSVIHEAQPSEQSVLRCDDDTDSSVGVSTVRLPNMTCRDSRRFASPVPQSRAPLMAETGREVPCQSGCGSTIFPIQFNTHLLESLGLEKPRLGPGLFPSSPTLARIQPLKQRDEVTKSRLGSPCDANGIRRGPSRHDFWARSSCHQINLSVN